MNWRITVAWMALMMIPLSEGYLLAKNYGHFTTLGTQATVAVEQAPIGDFFLVLQ